jgi:ribonuclease I
MSSSMNELDYFKLTLDIHKRTILKDVLQKEGISPDYTKTISREKIFNAVKDDIKAKPEILCKEYKNNYYVEEIRMCLDKTNDHKYIDCPRDYVDCPEDVYYP